MPAMPATITSKSWQQITGAVTAVHSPRGTAKAHASRAASITATRYYRSGGASTQEWLITFPEKYGRITISKIENATVRSSTWGGVLSVGTHEVAGQTIWIGGNSGVVEVLYSAERFA